MIGHNLPGQGLGCATSKELAFSLGSICGLPGPVGGDSLACILPRVSIGNVYSRYLPEFVLHASRNTMGMRAIDRWIIDREKVKSISQNTSLLSGPPPPTVRGDTIMNINRKPFICRGAVKAIKRSVGASTTERPYELRIHTHPVLCNKRCCDE